jgi:hypothetical protein
MPNLINCVKCKKSSLRETVCLAFDNGDGGFMARIKVMEVGWLDGAAVWSLKEAQFFTANVKKNVEMYIHSGFIWCY